MAPVVDGLKAEYEGDVEFRLVNVETDPDGPGLASKYGAQYVPTFVFLNADGTVAKTLVGEQSEAQLRSALDGL